MVKRFIDLPVFEFLTEEEKRLIMEKGAILSFDEREAIFKQGSFAVNSYYILEGMCKITYQSQEKKRILQLLHKDVMIGMDYALLGNYPYSLHTLTPVKMLVIPTLFLNSICDENLLFCKQISIELKDRLIDTIKWLADIDFKNIQGAVALFLLKYYCNAKYQYFSLSRTEMADILGYSRESIIHTLKEFSDEGLIEIKGKNIIIKNKIKLKQIIKHG